MFPLLALRNILDVVQVVRTTKEVPSEAVRSTFIALSVSSYGDDRSFLTAVGLDTDEGGSDVVGAV